MKTLVNSTHLQLNLNNSTDTDQIKYRVR